MRTFEPVTWSTGDDIDKDTLNQMASNENWLFNNMINGFYTAHGMHKNTGIKVIGGKFNVGPTKDKIINKNFSFGNFFTPGCEPIVTVSHTGGHRVFISIAGVAGGNQTPDHRGFQVHLLAAPTNATKNYFPHLFHVHWIALGW